MADVPVFHKRRIMFTVLTLLIPVLLIGISEAFLRVIDFGNYPALIQKEARFGAEKYVINSQVARRYFSLPPELTPEAASDAFDVVKKPGAVRIFCLGGSTTAGFPYEINATFPFQLKARLQKEYPNRQVEVINLGISAVNSYTVLDLLPEVLDLQPDLLIIYMGHNEFYGAFGAGSTQHLGNNRRLILWYLKLKRWRLFQLLEKTIRWGRGVLSKPQNAAAQPLMQAMAGKQRIPLNDEKVRIAQANFRENLREIVRESKKQNVKLLLSTLVSNLKDQPPFISAFSRTVDKFSQNRLETKLLTARVLSSEGKTNQALAVVEKIARIDSSAADLHFYRGQMFLKNGQSRRAFRDFSRARDLDLLRFRAPSAFNSQIREIAKSEDVPLVNMEEVFCEASPDGIPGKMLFQEHLHPNFDGYQLMAQAFFEAIKTTRLLDPNAKIVQKTQFFAETEIQKIIQNFRADSAGVTLLDLEFGNLRTFFLTHRWPFANQVVSAEMYQPLGDSLTKKLAIAHLEKKIFWDAAHYQLAEYFQKKQRLSHAFKELAAVQIAFPENYVPQMKSGDIYFAQRDYQAANSAYQMALSLSRENPFVLAKLGNTAVLMNQFENAIPALQRALQIDRKSRQLEAAQKVTALYLLGLSQANLRHFRAALGSLDKALQLQPGYQPAIALEKNIRRFVEQKQGSGD